MINIFIFSMLVSSSLPVQNNYFQNNIDGDWHSFISGGWKIIQEGNATTFVKKERDNTGQEIVYNFVGSVKEGNFIDEFSFAGNIDDNYTQTDDGDFCLNERTFKTYGRIENNVIHMTNCKIKEIFICLSGKQKIKVFNCSGKWTK